MFRYIFTNKAVLNAILVFAVSVIFLISMRILAQYSADNQTRGNLLAERESLIAEISKLEEDLDEVKKAEMEAIERKIKESKRMIGIHEREEKNYQEVYLPSAKSELNDLKENIGKGKIEYEDDYYEIAKAYSDVAIYCVTGDYVQIFLPPEKTDVSAVETFLSKESIWAEIYQKYPHLVGKQFFIEDGHVYAFWIRQSDTGETLVDFISEDDSTGYTKKELDLNSTLRKKVR